MSTNVVNELPGPQDRTRGYAKIATGGDTAHISYSRGAGRLSAAMQMIHAEGLGSGVLIAVLIAIGLVCLMLGAIYSSSLAGPMLEEFGFLVS